MVSEARKAAYNHAIRLLAQREHGRVELQRKLTAKHTLDPETWDALLDELEKANYLDDQRFTEMFVRSSVNRGQGPMKIRYALGNKGVDGAMTDTVLANASVDWCALASEQRAKKFGQEIPSDFKERARQSRFLAGRGFYGDTINAVFHAD